MSFIQGDCNNVLKDTETDSIDLIVTDPPYGIEFMGKDWDKAVVPTETWKECYRVLKQGKLAFIMCSPRQDVLSRMIVNLQDAGFRTNYTSIYWTFASGFPKAANISKLIDKRLGVKREQFPNPLANKQTGQIVGKGLSGARNDYDFIEPEPATEEAKKMEGAYVGFQPKPAVEIILVVSKGKTLTWLDDCRIPYQSEDDKASTLFRATTGFTSKNQIYHNDPKYEMTDVVRDEKGRFPANLLCQDDILNDGRVLKSSPLGFKGEVFPPSKGWNNHHMVRVPNKFNDEGSYSRYFSLDQWWAKTFPFLIVPKASKSERGEFNKHPTVKAMKLMSYLITMGSREGDLVLDPFCGSGTTCIAAEQLHRRWIGIELNSDYIEICNKRIAPLLQQLKLVNFSYNNPV